MRRAVGCAWLATWALACGGPDQAAPADAPPGLDDASPTDAAPSPDAAPALDPSDAVFDPTFVHQIEITIAPEAWDDIQQDPWSENWWTADVRIDGEAITDVGIRAYGAYSRRVNKTPIKLSFDRQVPGREFRGLEQLKLDGSTQDPGFLNEPLGASVLRSLGIPAARMTWAVVYANGERWGFYIVEEPIDDVFVGRWFDGPEGSLYGTTDYHYGQALNPMTEHGPLEWFSPDTAVGGDGSDIVAAAEAIASGTDAELDAVVDTEGIMRLSVTRAMFGDTDSFAADGNNFYLYNHAGRITVIPWDMDIAFGGLPSHYTNALEMGLDEPWLWSHYRINSLTGEPFEDTLYARTRERGWDIDGWVAQVLAGPLAPATVDAQVAAWAALIEDDACADNYHACASHTARVTQLREFLADRLARLAAR
jgi:hypothetical protein